MSLNSLPALLLLGLASLLASHATHAQKPILTTLHRFGDIHGLSPQVTPTLGTDGNIYGTTSFGGATNSGTLYKMTPAGQFTTLHVFTVRGGYNPFGALVQGKDGDFYGTTVSGGASRYGTVYRITQDGQFTTLHSFTGPDGSHPYAAVTLAPDGSFYGTTNEGGPYKGGTVFHMTASGTVTTLHSFAPRDGISSLVRVVYGPDGALYGTTSFGGAHNLGTIFRLTTDGAYSVLHDFAPTNGYGQSNLTLGPDGALYGTTVFYAEGMADYYTGLGTLYKITPSGRFTLLHKFSADGHGTNPYSALTLGTDGQLYGTTVSGGTYNRGTVFVMTPTGALTTLYKFHTDFDGSEPFGGVTFGPDGALYGAAYGSGAKGGGTLYKLTLPQ